MKCNNCGKTDGKWKTIWKFRDKMTLQCVNCRHSQMIKKKEAAGVKIIK